MAQSDREGILSTLVLSGVDESREAALERYCRELRFRLAEQTRILADASQELSAEIGRREEAQAALVQAQKLGVLGYLTSGITHDFNNVLQAVRNGYDLLASGNDNPRHHLVIDEGRRAIEHATSLTRRLLTFIRPGGRKLEALSPSSLMAEVEPLLRAVLKGGIKCEFAVAEDVWPIILDRGELETVLINLAVNARDAMPAGGRLLIAARNSPTREVRGVTLADGDYVVLSVQDTGTGMPPEVKARATEAFFTTKEPERGTGLGLAMANDFALRAGGALRIDSAPGSGTTIEVYLPRAAVPAPATAAAETHRGGVILLAEENEATRILAAQTLRALGYRVIEAGNGKAALALSYSVPALDLAIASATLPDGGGGGLAERLRIERPKLPMLFLGQGGTAGDADTLPRPVSPAAIAAAVSARLARRHAFEEREDALSTRMLARLDQPELKGCLALWRRLRGCDPLPRIDHAEALIAERKACHFVAAADCDGGSPRFRLLSVGRDLADRLGRPLEGMFVTGPEDDVVGSLPAAYAQTGRSRLPVYDWLRHKLGDGPATRFDRLILPLSEDGHTVSHLVGIVLFTDFPTDPLEGM
ncbi:MAG TPA: hypothetical protein HPQ04_03350 [Rhodospirillaceae bacterium]|nr:hypothetical protein [Rhodospirillaceae bacterium]